MKNLRIFYGFDLNLSEAFEVFGKDVWTANIYDTLKSMGHDMIPMNYALGDFFHYLKGLFDDV